MWSATSYEVTFNANGGQVTQDSKPVAYDQEYGSLPTPTKSGYTFLGWYTELEGGTQIISSTKYTTLGNQTIYAHWKQNPILATTLITPSTYGDSVNYSANGVTNWKVFLNDGTNIYIIAGDYVPNSGMTFTDRTSSVGAYCVRGENQSYLVNWLKDTSKWKAYANGINGLDCTATGGPTKEQLWSSYNNKYGTNHSASDTNKINLSSETGYSDKLYFPHKEGWNNCYYYWLASSYSSDRLWCLSCTGNVEFFSAGFTYAGARPLVCLPSGIYATKGNDGKWTFKK